MFAWVYTRVEDQRNSKIERSYWSRAKFSTKGFILGSRSKVSKNKAALKWHHFPPILSSPHLRKLFSRNIVRLHVSSFILNKTNVMFHGDLATALMFGLLFLKNCNMFFSTLDHIFMPRVGDKWRLSILCPI